MHADSRRILSDVRCWAEELGFGETAVTPVAPVPSGPFERWLARGCHGTMGYLERNRFLRANPEAFAPGSRSVLVCRMNYLPVLDLQQNPCPHAAWGFVARYARGRDYHKVMRQRLKKLGSRIEQHFGTGVVRKICVDSAPVMEKEHARRAGIGWIGKNTLLLSRRAGSFFVLGEIFLSLPLPATASPEKGRCGSCTRCVDSCPTGALSHDGSLDARRCLSYLTIEHKGSIPLRLRRACMNRLVGCDTCQAVCPWNRFAATTTLDDFKPRFLRDDLSLAGCFLWDEQRFHEKTAGTPIHRIGHERWLRNVAVALGNGPPAPASFRALQLRLAHPSALVREHTQWALESLCNRQ